MGSTESSQPAFGWWRLIGAGILAALAIATGGWWWLAKGVFTENAYVVGNVTPVAPEVAGPVVTLYTDDNMVVKAGDPLLQIDPVPFQIAVDEARADFLQVAKEAEAAGITVELTKLDRKAAHDAAIEEKQSIEEALKASEYSAKARKSLHQKGKELLEAARCEEPGLLALERNARDYAERFRSLAKSGDIPVQDSDNRDAAWKEAVARLNSLRSKIGSLESQVLASEMEVMQADAKARQSAKGLSEARARVERAKAALLQPDIAESTHAALRRKSELAAAKLAQARLRLANTLLRAPIGGIISKRTAQLGQSLVAGSPCLSITPLDFDNVWVIANLREDQASRTRLGQPVSVTVDAIPGKVFSCWVESFSGGTGSAFSLFPPDNATGNFTRIVQRLPVRLRFSEKENPGDRIRPGMSCKVRIDTEREIRASNREW